MSRYEGIVFYEPWLPRKETESNQELEQLSTRKEAEMWVTDIQRMLFSQVKGINREADAQTLHVAINEVSEFCDDEL